MDKLDELLKEIADSLPIRTGARRHVRSEREIARERSEAYAKQLAVRAKDRALAEKHAERDALRFRLWFDGREGKSLEDWRRIIDASQTEHRSKRKD
jgi:hypothetical protein